MAFYTEEQIRQARSIDLLTYLQTYEPTELVRINSNTWCTLEHDSLKISSNGKWMWWSRGFGGASALDYLIKVKGMQFIDAMKILSDGACTPSLASSLTPSIEVKTEKKELLLPERSGSSYEVISYLHSRGIDRDIVRDCINEGFIYESLPYHNVVFVGYNENGKAAYACYRATGGRRILGDVKGSDKTYSFRIDAPGSRIHVFESAIDLLSFATLMKIKTGNWRAEPMVSLGGIYAPGLNKMSAKAPAALMNALQNNSEVNTVLLHLDNDDAGRGASASIAAQLADRYIVKDDPPPEGKDCNDYLLQVRRKQQEYRRRSTMYEYRDYAR